MLSGPLSDSPAAENKWRQQRKGKERRRKKEEEKCGDGREERARAGERAWDSMVDSTNVQ